MRSWISNCPANDPTVALSNFPAVALSNLPRGQHATQNTNCTLAISVKNKQYLAIRSFHFTVNANHLNIKNQYTLRHSNHHNYNHGNCHVNICLYCRVPPKPQPLSVHKHYTDSAVIESVNSLTRSEITRRQAAWDLPCWSTQDSIPIRSDTRHGSFGHITTNMYVDKATPCLPPRLQGGSH